MMQNISRLEKILHVKFPNDFIEKMEFLMKKICNGNKLVINNPIGPVLIKKILEIDIEKEESIYRVYTQFRDLMKEGIIPIADAGYDDYICLYFMDRKLPPKVILWCYERALENIDYAIFPLADSLKEFIERIEQVDDI